MSTDTNYVPAPEPKNTRPAWVMPLVIVGSVFGLLLVLIVVLAIVLAATGGTDSEPAAAPTVTQTETTPEPADTETESTDPRDDAQYDMVLGLMDDARKESVGSDTDAICLAYLINPSKWERKFTGIATNTLGADQDVAEVAVADYFQDLCD